MSEATKIEWCDSTFNPWIGCTKISPACDHCYAEAQMDTRMGRVEWGSGKPRARTSAAYWRQPLRWNARIFWQCDTCGWRGEGPHLDGLLDDNDESVRELCPQCWPEPIAVKLARRRVFCASLADVFDNEADPEWRADLFELIAATPNLDWLLLTKRIGNVAAMVAEAFDAVKRRFWIGQEYMRLAHRDVTSPEWTDPALPPNVWLGATVVNQQEADRDIPKLLAVRAAKRFLSIEPMLGPVDVGRFLYPTHWHWDSRFKTPAEASAAGAYAERKRQGIVLAGSTFLDWIICGGESGPHARPMHPDWVRSLRDQCTAAGVPFLFKQWGQWLPVHQDTPKPITDVTADGRASKYAHMHWDGSDWEDIGHPDWVDFADYYESEQCVMRVGKRSAGRLLDGREHSEWPA